MPDFTAPTPTEPPAQAPLPLVPRSGPARRKPGRPVRRPLPDPAPVRRVAVPESAPPYDDTSDGSAWRAGPARPAAARTATLHTAAHATRSAAADRHAAAPSHQPATASGAGAWPSQFAQVLAETLAGSRPLRQIDAWTTEQARKRIGQLGPLMAATVRPRVRRVIIASPAADVLEMSVIVAIGPRVRAVAVRLERTAPAGRRARSPGSGRDAPRWLCTAVEAV